MVQRNRSPVYVGKNTRGANVDQDPRLSVPSQRLVVIHPRYGSGAGNPRKGVFM